MVTLAILPPLLEMLNLIKLFSKVVNSSLKTVEVTFDESLITAVVATGVATFAGCFLLADKAIESVEKGTDFIFINFANADMVGHTANKEALLIAVEEVDTQLKRVVETVSAKGGVVLVSADHGNAEQNIEYQTGEKHTAHTTNLVPFIITTKGILQNGTLADIAPTTLGLLGLVQPEEMTGKNLLQS